MRHRPFSLSAREDCPPRKKRLQEIPGSLCPGAAVRRSSYLWAARESTIRSLFVHMVGKSATFSALGYNAGAFKKFGTAVSAVPIKRRAIPSRIPLIAVTELSVSCRLENTA
jgi:hypothetical protein